MGVRNIDHKLRERDTNVYHLDVTILDIAIRYIHSGYNHLEYKSTWSLI